jgi:hypothetical protein
MPVNQKMMDNLQKEYGKEKGTRVYYAMENKYVKERREHPSFSPSQVRQIVQDHDKSQRHRIKQL